MLSSMSNGVITINSDGEVVTCNKSGLKILKIKESDIIKKNPKNSFLRKNHGFMKKFCL